MTTRKHAFYGILALVSLLGLGITQSARANFIETINQVGANVVATGSGTFNFTGLTPTGFSNTNGFSGFVANQGYIQLGPTPDFLEIIYSGITGPTSFGSSGNFFVADIASGDPFVMDGLDGEIFLRTNYVSGTALSNSMTFNNQTLASLGVDPGTYVWTWGNEEAADSFTLQIGPASVPDSGTSFSLLGLSLMGLAFLRRKLC